MLTTWPRLRHQLRSAVFLTFEFGVRLLQICQDGITASMAARSGSVGFLIVIMFVRVDCDKVVLEGAQRGFPRYMKSVSNYFLASFILYDFTVYGHVRVMDGDFIFSATHHRNGKY